MSVTLPRIGTIRVHDDTRRLRRLLRPIAQSDRGTGTVVMAPPATPMTMEDLSAWTEALPRSP
jgi:hypothetical protein